MASCVEVQLGGSKVSGSTLCKPHLQHSKTDVLMIKLQMHMQTHTQTYTRKESSQAKKKSLTPFCVVLHIPLMPVHQDFLCSWTRRIADVEV